MSYKKYISIGKTLAIALSIAAFIPSQLLAQSSKPEVKFPKLLPVSAPTKTTETTGRLRFTLDNQEALKKNDGGSKHASCLRPEYRKPSFTALIPSKEYYGKTVTDQPSLYWYIPRTTATFGEFLLFNEGDIYRDQEIYQIRFKLPKKPGIVKLTIPASAGMKIGKSYSWGFFIICDEEDRSGDEYKTGLITRTTLTPVLNNFIQKSQPLNRAKVYAKYKIWYDALSSIADVHQQNKLDWESFLSSVGLEKLSQEPFVDLPISTPELKKN